MLDTVLSAQSLGDALLESTSTHVVVVCRRGTFSDDEVDALLAWQTCAAAHEPRRVTLVKSPWGLLLQIAIGTLFASSLWVVLPPLHSIEPGRRLRSQSPDIRVKIARRSRCAALELDALRDGSVLYWV